MHTDGLWWWWSYWSWWFDSSPRCV